MFAAGRELGELDLKKFRESGPVSDGPLSQGVVVTMGVEILALHYGRGIPTLRMFTDPGGTAHPLQAETLNMV